MTTHATTHSSGLNDLWSRIEAFDIDGADPASPSPFPFVTRLARENAWPETFAQRVVNEYKRFIFLAMAAGHPVTPSDQVDQAWHLHLTYTRSYWQRLCGEVLPKPLHHDPTKGGESENAKFDDWYAKTKESYTRIFGEAPPGDIWPDAAVRFGDDLHYERINTKHHFVIPKRVAGRLVRFGLIAGGAMMLVAGCTPMVLGTEDGWVSMMIFIGLIVLLVIFLKIASKTSRDRGSGCGGSGCSTGSTWFGSSDTGRHGGSGCGSHHGDADGGSGCASSGCSGGGCGGGGCGGGGD